MIEYRGVRWLQKLPYLRLGVGNKQIEVPIDAALAHRLPGYLEKLGIIPEPQPQEVFEED